ncbi:hypothetical protein SAMN05421503_1470 [Terribacillus aidingensis]|uniref:Uncharacterized protein n=1 Tax=Terribacillus aidingensis TaxID=586416 RepID=A0A285NKN6_9BACI|nr:hypothetical protein [Terribacillus aidingensis]SNZ10015.1 hypothetical protein SAMN05421503_1470 [Terribacillus aidingensis]
MAKVTFYRDKDTGKMVKVTKTQGNEVRETVSEKHYDNWEGMRGCAGCLGFFLVLGFLLWFGANILS